MEISPPPLGEAASHIRVPGDFAETAHRITGSELLYRIGLSGGLVASVCIVFLAMGLYVVERYLSHCSSGSLPPELLGKPDENSFGAPDVAEPIRIFVLDHFADELRAAFAEPGERIVDVLHGEHDA